MTMIYTVDEGTMTKLADAARTVASKMNGYTPAQMINIFNSIGEAMVPSVFCFLLYLSCMRGGVRNEYVCH